MQSFQTQPCTYDLDGINFNLPCSNESASAKISAVNSPTLNPAAARQLVWTCCHGDIKRERERDASEHICSRLTNVSTIIQYINTQS